MKSAISLEFVSQSEKCLLLPNWRYMGQLHSIFLHALNTIKFLKVSQECIHQKEKKIMKHGVVPHMNKFIKKPNILLLLHSY